ncbi:hypothetical protein B0H99_11079 [Planomicrobium soli]|uniref:Uncharacterized protein n=1 Tax=Planomicrobium soli TaxID=1176648 RepID=A0A2P8GG77_9BACL|nr:hypothetical protein B0H99_11079 [Planomicrobium soli]
MKIVQGKVTALGKIFSSELGWLEYSLKRSLWIECTNEEQKMGTNQVVETILEVKKYAEKTSILIDWLKIRLC